MANPPIPHVGPSKSSGGLSVVPGDPGSLQVGQKTRELTGILSNQMQKLWRTIDGIVATKNYANINTAMNAVSEALNQIYSLPQAKASVLDMLQKAATELEAVDTEDARQAVEGLDAVLMGCAADGVVANAAVLDRLVRTAGFLDDNYAFGAATILDKIALAAEFPQVVSLGETRSEMYDADAHNVDSMWEIVKHEIAENRKQDSVETHRDTADSLSTRYDPELPGVQVVHVAPQTYQSMATHKVYNYGQGFTTTDGRKVPGGGVQNQTPRLQAYSPVNRMFETRVDVSKRRG